MLRAPEVVVATWRAAQPDCQGLQEDEVREALATLDPLWSQLFPAEQARIVQLLVDRVEVYADNIHISLRRNGLKGLVAELSSIAAPEGRAA